MTVRHMGSEGQSPGAAQSCKAPSNRLSCSCSVSAELPSAPQLPIQTHPGREAPVLTFSFKHAYELCSHGHGHVGDEAGCQLLAVGHQVVARRDEEVGDVGEEVQEASSSSCDICCEHREEQEGKHQPHIGAVEHFSPACHPWRSKLLEELWLQADDDSPQPHSKAEVPTPQSGLEEALSPAQPSTPWGHSR